MCNSATQLVVCFLSIAVLCGSLYWPTDFKRCDGQFAWDVPNVYAYSDERTKSVCVENLCWEALPRKQAQWNGSPRSVLVHMVNYTPVRYVAAVCIDGIPTWTTTIGASRRTVALRTVEEYDDSQYIHEQAAAFPDLTDKPAHLGDQIFSNDCVRRTFYEGNFFNKAMSWYEPVQDGHLCGDYSMGECYAWRCWKQNSSPQYCAPALNIPDGDKSTEHRFPLDCSGAPPIPSCLE